VNTVSDKVQWVYVLLERHHSAPGAWLDRRISAFATLELAQAQAEQYAEARGELIQEWNRERQYLHEVRFEGTTGGDYSYVMAGLELHA